MRGGGVLTNTDGASAVEFALAAPLFLVLLLGGMHLGFLGLTMSSLQNSAAEAARCASVNTAVCGSAAATETYAASLYAGYGERPVFIATKTGCGNSVTGTVTFHANAAFFEKDFDLVAQACFP